VKARLAVAALVLAGAVSAEAQWKPVKPVTIIVPWAAGSAIDLVTRLAAIELQSGLGEKIFVVNQPGGAGSVGTRSAMQAPRDGHTWTAGAAKQLGTYPLLGLLDSKVDDFHLYLSVTNVSVVSVNPGSPHRTLQQLLEAMKARPGEIRVATAGHAGNASSGHFAMEAISKAAGVRYRHLAYDGGATAVIATVAGEGDVTTQPALEQAGMLKGKRLRPLAVVADQALTIEGVGTIQPITQTIADFPSIATAIGIFIPKGAPAEVADTMEKLWAERVATSAKIRQYAQERGVLFTPVSGKAARDLVWPTIVEDAYMLHAAGMAKVTPESIGIKR
jgi:tripartite-type tricarboxylate transporter receptor subunit TctC